MDVNFSPSSMVDWYKMLDVMLANSVPTVAIRKYRCSVPGYGGTLDAEAFKDDLVSTQNVSNVQRVMRVFTGKGSPLDINKTLGEVERARDALLLLAKGAKKPGDLDIKAAELARTEFNKAALKKDKPDNFAELRSRFQGFAGKVTLQERAGYDEMLSGDDWPQKVCDKYIGLDCNGFVGNYVMEVSTINGPQAHSLRPSDWLANATRSTPARKTVDEIQPLDIIVWSTVHIAIVDSVEDVANGRRPFVLAQSSGGGPQYFRTEFRAAQADGSTPQFSITIPAPQGMTLVGGLVKVASIGLTLKTS